MRKLLLFSATILFSGIMNAQVGKPRIMVFPARNWMIEKGYTKGPTDKPEMDYQRALDNNKELYGVINTINTLMSERGFPLESLAETLKQLAEQNALDNMDQNQNGEEIAESPRDKILKTARPDITLEITWTINQVGPKRSVTFDMVGLNAASAKQVAGANGTGPQSFTPELPILLKEAVLAHLDNFNSQLQTHFQDMFDNGREISLNVKVWQDSPKKLNDEVNDDGDELKDAIIEWVKKNTVKGRYSLANSSPTMMSLKQVRIPLLAEDGSSYDADQFAAALRKYLKMNFQLPSESSAIGLGQGEIVLGGKRN